MTGLDDYQVLGVATSADMQAIEKAYNARIKEVEKLRTQNPVLYVLRVKQFNDARDNLRTKLEAIAKSGDETRRAGQGQVDRSKTAWPLANKLGVALQFIFGPALRLGMYIGRVAAVVSLLWLLFYADFLSEYRQFVKTEGSQVISDAAAILPDMDFRAMLPSSMGGTATYNSLNCQKIRAKYDIAKQLLKEEEQKSSTTKIAGIAQAFGRLVQGDSDKAKQHLARAGRETERTDQEIRQARVFLSRVEIDHLECFKTN